jgi:hypothetical protein
MNRVKTEKNLGVQEKDFHLLFYSKWNIRLVRILLLASISIPTCFATRCFATSTHSEESSALTGVDGHLRETIALRGIFLTNHSWCFSIHDQERNGSRWMKIGDLIDDWKITDFNQTEQRIQLTRGVECTYLSMSKSSDFAMASSTTSSNLFSNQSNPAETLHRKKLAKNRFVTRAAKLAQVAETVQISSSATASTDYYSMSDQFTSDTTLVEKNEGEVVYVVNGYDPRVLVNLSKYASE